MLILRRPFLDGKISLRVEKTREEYVLRVMYQGKRIGKCDFKFCEDGDGTIWVSSLNVSDKYRFVENKQKGNGLGRLMMEYIFCVANLSGRNVELTSAIEADGFYHRLGMKERGSFMTYVVRSRRKINKC